jgi:predicted nucleic acid-binding protein
LLSLRETRDLLNFSLNKLQDAGRAFRIYAGRRRKQERSPPRRILADFLIGAQARDRGASLATMDEEHYRTAFPKLDLITL